MASNLRYTVDVTVHLPSGPTPCYRYTGEFEPAGDYRDDDPRLREQAMARACIKAYRERQGWDPEQVALGGESAADARRRLATELVNERRRREEAEAELAIARKAADGAATRSHRHARRIDALEHEACELVEALTEGPMPPPWWLRAANALNALRDLAVDGAEVMGPGDEPLQPVEETLQRVADDTRRTVLPLD